jgi:hypothetical protein
MEAWLPPYESFHLSVKGTSREVFYLMPKDLGEDGFAAKNLAWTRSPSLRPEDLDFEETKKLIEDYKPYAENIETFLDPIIQSAYGYELVMDYYGTVNVQISGGDINLGEAKKLCTEFLDNFFSTTSPIDILKAVLDLHEGRKKDIIINTFYKDYKNINSVMKGFGMTYKAFAPERYIANPKELREAFIVDQLVEDEYKPKNRFYMPFNLKGVKLVKTVKANCPPFTKSSNIEATYVEGLPMDTQAAPKAFRLCMDYLKYGDRLEIITRKKPVTGNNKYPPAVPYLQLKQDNRNLTVTQAELRELIKNDESLSNEIWITLLLRIFMVAGGGSSLITDDNKVFLKDLNSSEIFFNKKIPKGFSGSEDFRLKISGSPIDETKLSPNTIIHYLEDDISDLKTWLEGFEGMVKMIKENYTESERADEVSMKGLFIRIMGNAIDLDPINLIAHNADLGGYLASASEIAKRLINLH